MRALNFEQIREFSSEEVETKNIKGKRVTFTTYKRELKDGVLIVVQAFFPILFPNYISLNGVGKIYAEGIVFSKEGKKNSAEDEMILSYR